MRSVKPGRGPSAMGAAGGIVGVLFGIFWTVLAFTITRDAPIPLVSVIFPLFGVLFVILGIANVLYNLNNATRPDRFSSFDITEDDEEPDPLNAHFGRPRPAGSAAPRRPGRQHPGEFCPFCGAKVGLEVDFCPRCGKDI